MPAVHGLHHVTCICGEPQANVDFYAGVVGLRLVKRTVNQDAPDTYHLFYADAEGTPGTDVTFFPWPQMPPARDGTGLANEIVLAAPSGSLGYWEERLGDGGVEPVGRGERFGETLLRFRDPHGLALAIAETDEERAFTPWSRGSVPVERQLRGLHSVALWERALDPTAAHLTGALGFEAAGEDGDWRRFGADGGGSGHWVDVRVAPGERRGTWGTGSIHHVALRARDDEEQGALREAIAAAGGRPTQVIDRFWFRSIYFKEPGGALLEIATDGPGFAIDGDAESLGDRLVLPPFLEPRREQIEAALPPLRVPS